MKTIQITEQKKEWAIKIAVGILCLALGYLGIVKPALGEAVFLSQSIQKAKQRLGLYREITLLKTKLTNAGRFFLKDQDRHRVLGKISALANKNKLEVLSVTPKTTTEGRFLKLRVEISATGTFFSLLNFLKSVETMEPAMAVKDISLTRGNQSTGASVIQSQIILETYLIEKAGLAA